MTPNEIEAAIAKCVELENVSMDAGETAENFALRQSNGKQEQMMLLVKLGANVLIDINRIANSLETAFGHPNFDGRISERLQEIVGSIMRGVNG